MDEAATFAAVGGVPMMAAGADPNDPAAVTWNFGVKPEPPAVTKMIRDTPSLHSMFPNLGGRWDGKTRVNHHEAVRKVLGWDIPAQLQPRGTCGGRAGSQGSNILECILIATGKRAKFRTVSHAWLYYLARKKYGMLNGSPGDPNNDGVASGSIPEVMASNGMITQEEGTDTNYVGPGSDDLACKWGAGQIDRVLETKLMELAKDNIVSAWAPCKSAEECADGLAAGGVIIQSDTQGYSMTRDAEGVCSPRGTWAHYQIRTGVGLTPSGRRVFDYNQSWGETTPSGPRLPGCPGNCFGVEWAVQDRLCSSGRVAVVFSFPLWDLEKGSYDIPWIF